MSRCARIRTSNMGEDTPLHLAAVHGQRDLGDIVSDMIV